MNWLFIITAGLFETGFAFCMGKARETTGTASLLWWLAFGACMAASLALMFRAISGEKGIPIGTAYAVWTGIGAVGGVLVGIFFFHEPMNFWRIFFAVTLIASVVGLKFFG